jgi:anti-anti-sigma factor
MAGVLVFDTLPGLAIGIAFSIVLLIYRASRPNVVELGHTSERPDEWADLRRHPRHRPEPGVVVLRVEAGLFFANAEHVRQAVRAAAAPDEVHTVVLDAETVPFIDVSAAAMLATVRSDLRAEGVKFLVAHDIGQVRDALLQTGTQEALGERHVYPSVRAAVAAARSA